MVHILYFLGHEGIILPESKLSFCDLSNEGGLSGLVGVRTCEYDFNASFIKWIRDS